MRLCICHAEDVGGAADLHVAPLMHREEEGLYPGGVGSMPTIILTSATPIRARGLQRGEFARAVIDQCLAASEKSPKIQAMRPRMMCRLARVVGKAAIRDGLGLGAMSRFSEPDRQLSRRPEPDRVSSRARLYACHLRVELSGRRQARTETKQSLGAVSDRVRRRGASEQRFGRTVGQKQREDAVPVGKIRRQLKRVARIALGSRQCRDQAFAAVREILEIGRFGQACPGRSIVRVELDRVAQQI